MPLILYRGVVRFAQEKAFRERIPVAVVHADDDECELIQLLRNAQYGVRQGHAKIVQGNGDAIGSLDTLFVKSFSCSGRTEMQGKAERLTRCMSRLLSYTSIK